MEISVSISTYSQFMTTQTTFKLNKMIERTNKPLDIIINDGSVSLVDSISYKLIVSMYVVIHLWRERKCSYMLNHTKHSWTEKL
jgi:hypothetical protein